LLRSHRAKDTNVRDRLNHQILDAVNLIKEYLDKTNLALLGTGDDSSIDRLGAIFAEGVLTKPAKASDISSYELEKALTKLLLAISISATWRMQGLHPVVVNTTAPCESIGVGGNKWIDAKDISTAHMCESNILYYLGVIPNRVKCNRNRDSERCDALKLTLGPGMKSIEVPNEYYGGLHKFNLIGRLVINSIRKVRECVED